MGANVLKPLGTPTNPAKDRSLTKRIVVTLIIVGLATGLRYSLNPLFGASSLWLFFYPAVLFSAWYGRLSCGLLSTTLCMVLASTLWAQPVSDFAEWVSVVSFGVMGALISFLIENSHKAVRAERVERKEREREREFFESALSSSRDAFMVVDKNWHYIYVNDVAANMGRQPREKVLGSVLWDLHPYLKESEFYLQFLKCREQKVGVQFDYYYAPFDLWTEIRAYPIGENIAAYVLDISARKKTETELAEAKKKLIEHAASLERIVAERTTTLQETIAELESFSYTISHDLRAPLRALESFSQFVLDDYGDKLDPQGLEYLNRIRDSARRMDALISDVLIYSKLSRAELKFEPLDLDDLTRSIVLEYSSLNLSLENIEIKSPLGHVCGNKTMLTQTISNLLNNAVKFVKPGEQPSVKVWSEIHEQRVRLFVQDKGIGIPAENQKKIFEIFQCAHEGSYEGTGIGLAIVKRSVERMEGTFGFFSKENEGSTFWVELPQA